MLLHAWLVFSYLEIESYPVLSRIAIGVHILACVGPFWMIADWFIKKQKRTLERWMWLFFVPWGFVWYYFEIHRLVKGPERNLA